MSLGINQQRMFYGCGLCLLRTSHGHGESKLWWHGMVLAHIKCVNSSSQYDLNRSVNRKRNWFYMGTLNHCSIFPDFSNPLWTIGQNFHGVATEWTGSSYPCAASFVSMQVGGMEAECQERWSVIQEEKKHETLLISSNLSLNNSGPGTVVMCHWILRSSEVVYLCTHIPTHTPTYTPPPQTQIQ